MKKRKIGIVFAAIVAFVATIMPLSTTASAMPGVDRSVFGDLNMQQQSMMKKYKLNKHQMNQLVIDSNLSREEALGDNVVPAENQAMHQAMKPWLRVVPVIYRGYDDKVHLGQIVVHKDLVYDTIGLFAGMFYLNFPIQSVIPASQFSYNDEASMQANNSTNYRPEPGSEHRKGAAFDLNPFDNPFDVTYEDGTRIIQPEGASYDPTAKGAITKDSDVRKLWTSFHWEWGGNWGDPEADPPTDFYKVDFFDYQHFNLDYTRFYDLPVPDGV